jgi:hypothetical protein
VLGIITDTNMTNREYALAGSIFFLGYFLAQVIQIYLKKKENFIN